MTFIIINTELTTLTYEHLNLIRRVRTTNIQTRVIATTSWKSAIYDKGLAERVHPVWAKRDLPDQITRGQI